MKTKIDYIYLDEINGYEFSLIVHVEEKKQPVEVLVIHHESCMVRTINFVENTTKAIELVKQCIQKGFKQGGINFIGIGQYHLPVTEYTNLPAVL